MMNSIRNNSLAIVIKNLKKSYESMVLQDINLEVPQGEILGIIGKSGAGKSTLFRCLNGLEQPTVGTITIDNQLFTGISEKEKRRIQQKIGNVFQSFNLLSRLTAFENVMFPLKLLQGNSEQNRSKALNMLKLVGLKGKENSYPSQLSGGQSQRVAIARALISDASLLLCDEFTSALDFETSLEILELLRDLNKRLGVTIIMITHDMAVVREICNEVCVLEEGRIVEKNNITSILLYPQNTVTKSLIRNLINRDLPHHLQERLRQTPTPQSAALLRLFFSSEAAEEPIIFSIIKKYDIPINILFGNLDHIRETAFGCLIVSIPYEIAKITELMKDLKQRGVSSEIIGYLPQEASDLWNN
ncbi:MAG: ATP-binding cassette domain-containing protein [Alphaproteobacteria bacterium]|jgi:D-methionine transport system ATP-binding protein|nr:ATP-binding cassette domain-containing protein [Alphaproteobacteria bacterium]MBP7729437.1 ATP-binding cassette domain-containing protein [Alphaproteobacteria bacterium]